MPYRLGKKEILFILNAKGRLYKFDVETLEVTELSYTGEFCQDILLFNHSNLRVTLMCHTMSNSISFYFVDQMSNNSRTRSRVPTNVIGIDPKLEVIKKAEDDSILGSLKTKS